MGVRERRDREAGQRRETILAAGRDLFLRQGYERTTMPQIAAAAELAPGTLYLYFPGKGALYLELLAEGYQQLLERLREAVAGGTSPLAQAQALLRAFFDYAHDHPAYFDIIFFMLRTRAPGDVAGPLGSSQMGRLLDLENQCRQVAAGVLRQLRADDRGVELTVDAIWSMLAGVVTFFRSESTYSDVAGRAAGLILAGLTAPD
jgi:AcrR family transcriptional regulator